LTVRKDRVLNVIGLSSRSFAMESGSTGCPAGTTSARRSSSSVPAASCSVSSDARFPLSRDLRDVAEPPAPEPLPPDATVATRTAPSARTIAAEAAQSHVLRCLPIIASCS
jgi:hypothetical protein